MAGSISGRVDYRLGYGVRDLVLHLYSHLALRNR